MMKEYELYKRSPVLKSTWGGAKMCILSYNYDYDGFKGCIPPFPTSLAAAAAAGSCVISGFCSLMAQ